MKNRSSVRTNASTRFGLVLGFATIAFAFLPAAADAYVYWVNDADKTIGQASLDGVAVDNEFVSTLDYPCDVATNGTYVYWTGGEGVGYVGRAPIATGVAQDHFIQTADDIPCGVAVDSSHIYFNNYVNGAIGRATLDGNTIDQTFITGGVNPQHPYVANGKVYFTNKGYGCPPGCTVGRADVDGDSVNQNFITDTHDPPSGVAADSGHVYWGNGGSVGRSNLNGGQVQPGFIDTPGYVCDVAVDGSHVYWADYGEDDGGFIGRASLDGSHVDPHFIHTTGGTCGVAVDTDQEPGGFIFTEEPRITCAGTCRVVIVQIKSDGAGNVIAEQIKPGQQRGALRDTAPRKGKTLFAKLRQHVTDGENDLKLKPTKAGKKALRKAGRLKAKMRFTFTPDGGDPFSVVETVKVQAKK